MSVRPAKTQISLGIRPVWSESSLSAWRKLESLATHWAHSENCDQTGRMPRLIWVFAGRTAILLVLSCCGSYACETWTVYQRHAKRLNHFHIHYLRKFLQIRWQDKIPGTDALKRAGVQGIHTLLKIVKNGVALSERKQTTMKPRESAILTKSTKDAKPETRDHHQIRQLQN